MQYGLYSTRGQYKQQLKCSSNLPATLVEIQSFNFDSTAPTREGEEFKTTNPSSDLCLRTLSRTLLQVQYGHQ